MLFLSAVPMLLGLFFVGVPEGAVAFTRSTPPASGRRGGQQEAIRRRVDPDQGAGNLVAVIRAPGSDGACQEIVTRIVAELMADGIPVMALACPEARPDCLAASGIRPFAIVSVEQRDRGRVVEVRAGDGLDSDRSETPLPGGDGGAGHVRRLSDNDAAGGAASLAIRAVELLKAMLIELEDTPSPAEYSGQVVVQRFDTDAVPATRKAAPFLSSVPPVGRHNLTMNVGVAAIGGFSGLRTAIGPAITIGRRSSDHVLLSAVLNGPAFGPEQRTAAGSAAVRHEMVILQADLLGLFWNVMVLRAGVGAGIYHVHVNGQTSTLDPPPIRGSGGGFAALLSWSVGVVTNFSSNVGIFLDGRLLVLTPTPLVTLNGQEVGRAGNPGLAVSAGLEMRL